MPQLDLFSWFNQVITTVMVIFVFYMFLVLCFLPNTTSIMKGRTKLANLRTISVNIIMLMVVEYVTNIKENLMNLLVNNFVPIYSYFYQVNNNNLDLNILRTCYANNVVNIDKVVINAALVDLVNNNINLEDTKLMVGAEEVETINNVLKG
jgi:hypothetical protein